MADSRSVEMESREIARFLDARGTGVLSLAAGNEPYAIPVSFGFDRETTTFHLRLGYRDESRKRSFVETSDHAELVVYDETADGWMSVIARGRLHELADSELTPELVERLSTAELPHFEMWEESKEDLQFTIGRVDVDELTGRKAHPGVD